MALQMKSKFEFVDGIITKPNYDLDHLLGAWNRCNALVLPWLSHSVFQKLLPSCGSIMPLQCRQNSDLPNVIMSVMQQYTDLFSFTRSSIHDKLLHQDQELMGPTAIFAPSLPGIPPPPDAVSHLSSRTVQQYRDNDCEHYFLQCVTENYASVRILAYYQKLLLLLSK